MNQPSPERRRARARHNGIKSRYGADAPETLAAREELRALAAEEQIREAAAALVPDAPDITDSVITLLRAARRTRGAVPAA